MVVQAGIRGSGRRRHHRLLRTCGVAAPSFPAGSPSVLISFIPRLVRANLEAIGRPGITDRTAPMRDARRATHDERRTTSDAQRTRLTTTRNTHQHQQFVADGVFYAELNELLTRELAEDGYSGVEVRVTPLRTEIIIRATRTQNVLGAKGRRIRELTSVVQKRFKFAEGAVELYAEKVANRGLCAVAQAESLRYKLLGGLAVRRACYGVLRFVMESGAKGCEVIVSGKLRAQRAKSMKFKDGYMVSSGNPTRVYIDSAVRHVLLRQGVLGIKVKIMKDYDPSGKVGPKEPLPDIVIVHNPKAGDE